MDGTGDFSSSSVHCCETHHGDGRVTSCHPMPGTVVVHPERSEFFPLAPEPIMKGDGARKHDCERTAAKRLRGEVRRAHSHVKRIVVEDGPGLNGPPIELLKRLDLRCIVGAKRAAPTALFAWVESRAKPGGFLCGPLGTVRMGGVE